MNKKAKAPTNDLDAAIAAEIAAGNKDLVDEPKEKPTMAAQLQKHRAKYGACVSYTNRLSLNNGDEVAQLLAGKTPEVIMAAAEVLCGFEEGELTAKYGHLNKGQQRMNAGNRIRSTVKKGTVTVDQLAKALA
tara:strand:+ start:552 stop:950 length:399 start_codon:yes stop_codon:yes gene_type:complete